MRIGIVLLPQLRWRDDARRWRAAEEMGFDTAWTYDHLSWRDLAGQPWLATVPLLAAAAAVTSTIRLGTWVASPNFRHPVPFAKDLLGLDDISDGRLTVGLGAGGSGFDATATGGRPLTPRERVDRFAEFTELLDVLLSSGGADDTGAAAGTTWSGERYAAVAARMLPGTVQRPRPPFVVAANGPRSMRTVAAHGQGWATTGPEDADEATWWRTVAELGERLDGVCADVGRDPATLQRYLNVDSAGYAMSSAGRFADVVGRAREVGVDEVVVHWPRAEGPYAGDEAVLEAVAGDLDALRGPA